MGFEFLRAVIEQEGHRGRALRDHPHAAIDDGVLHHAFAGEAGEIALAPLARPCKRQGDQRARSPSLRARGRGRGVREARLLGPREARAGWGGREI